MTRRIVDSREVYHLWAHQAQSDARNAQGSVSFSGPYAYSYGACIGVVRYVGTPARPVFLVSDSRWSVTTSKHQGWLRRAIPSENMIVLADPNAKPPEALADFRRRYYAAKLRGEAARTDVGRAAAEREMATILTHAALYRRLCGWEASRFRVRTRTAERAARRADMQARKARRREVLRRELWRLFPAGPAEEWGRILALPAGERAVVLKAARASYRERCAAEQAARKARFAAFHARREAEAREQEATRPARIAAWCAGGAVSVADVGYPLLRIAPEDGATVETSYGARVPLAHVRLALLAGIGTRAFAATPLGSYGTPTVGEDGAVRIGCHTFPRAEVERFAASVPPAV